MSRKKKEDVKGYPSVAHFLLKTKKNFFADKVASHVENSNTNTTETVEHSDLSNKIELEKKLEISEKELKQAKKLLRASSDVNLEKDLAIKKLMPQNSNNGGLLYEEFSQRFEDVELKQIRSIHAGESNDSKFVLNIMKVLYKNESEKLKNRSATGRKFKNTSKLEVSFEKKNLLNQLLNERVAYESQNMSDSAQQFTRRTKNLNKLIRYAIHNILASLEKSHLKRKRDREDNPSAKRLKPSDEPVKFKIYF